MPLYIGQPRSMEPADILAWVKNALHDIERHDRTLADVAMIAQDFTVENYNVTRTIDASTASATDVADFLCTFIDDIRRRGKEGKD